MKASQQLSRPGLAEQMRGRALPPVTHRPSPIYFAAIFGWTMAAVSAVMIAIVRWPLGSPHWFVFVKALLLPGAAIACATLFTVRHVERGGAYSALLVSTIAVIFLPCLAWVNGPLADVVIYPAVCRPVGRGSSADGIRHVCCTHQHVGLRRCLRLSCRLRLFPVDQFSRLRIDPNARTGAGRASTSWTLFFMPPSPTCSSSMAC